jgi:hypothetical protein
LDGLSDFAESVSGFYSKSAVDQLLLLGWYLEAVEGKASFNSTTMRTAFQKVGVDPPDVTQYLDRLAKKKPPQLVKVSGGYKLAGSTRRSFDTKIGDNPSVVAVSKLLSDLPNKVPSTAERDFLAEALNCYKVKAYRAAIVMAWNLAYDHLMEWLLADQSRLDKFNAAVPSRFPKKKNTISTRDDFEEFKESEVIAVCRTARLLGKNIVEILEAKLKRRNTVAHPSTIVVTQAQADDAITDLVNNVVLALAP